MIWPVAPRSLTDQITPPLQESLYYMIQHFNLETHHHKLTCEVKAIHHTTGNLIATSTRYNHQTMQLPRCMDNASSNFIFQTDFFYRTFPTTETKYVRRLLPPGSCIARIKYALRRFNDPLHRKSCMIRYNNDTTCTRQ